jgi:hypothetical protein
MVFCTRCGTQLEPDSRFCCGCGAAAPAPAKGLAQAGAPAFRSGVSPTLAQGGAAVRAQAPAGKFSVPPTQAHTGGFTVPRAPAYGGGFPLPRPQVSANGLPQAGAQAYGQMNSFTFSSRNTLANSDTLSPVDEDEEEDDDDCVVVDGVKKPVKPRTAFLLFMVDARAQANAVLKLKRGTPGKMKAANDLMKTWFNMLSAADKARYQEKEAAERQAIPKQFPAGAAFKPAFNPACKSVFKPPKTSQTTGSAAPRNGGEPIASAARGPATLTPAATAHRAGKGKEPACGAARGKPAGKTSELGLVGVALREFGRDVTSFLGLGSEETQELQQETDESVSVDELMKCVDAYFNTYCRYWERVYLVQGTEIREMDPEFHAQMMVKQLLLRLERFTGDCPIECLVNGTWCGMVLTAGDLRYLLHEEQRETLLQAARERFAEFAETTPVDDEELMRFHDANMSSGWRAGPSD